MRFFSPHFFLVCGFACCASLAHSQPLNLYFPPKVGNTWQTIAPSNLGICQERIDSLYHFLETHNTKSFILLKDGKIVLEKYFGTFVQDSIWYWASAGKSLTAFLIGQAQDEGFLDIHDKTNQYLGAGWTSASPDKENLITVWHQLTMTSGLDDSVPDDNCELPSCLIYKADAGTRWAYHNAPYRLLHSVIEEASDMTINQFTKSRLLDRIGMKGLWVDHIMYSRTRDMARYGLLALARGVWDGDTLLQNPLYFQAMNHRSQDLNKSYGYLWWLNGQESFMLPGLQFVFPGKLFKNAPDDMYAALGKNDQKIHVVPSKGVVVIRMGNDAGYTGIGGNQVPIVFDDEMWKYINLLNCSPVSTLDWTEAEATVLVFPNPALSAWRVESAVLPEKIELYDALGKRLRVLENTTTVTAEDLSPGQYWLRIHLSGKVFVRQVQH